MDAHSIKVACSSCNLRELCLPMGLSPDEMSKLDQGKYEAPAAFRLPEGRWCLLLDYYGVPGKGQGYVPFVAETLESGAFIRSDAGFSFPYGFKHGTVLVISDETCSALESLVIDD